jgi:PKD repeat protein/photosystem II stability/assembly factor-like uncharacterized protein
MLHKICASLTLAFAGLSVHAQDWTKKMADPSANFYDIQNSFNQYWKKEERKETLKSFFSFGPKTEEKNEGFIMYKRWESFVEPRVYPSGDRSLLRKNAEEIERSITDHSYRSSRMAGGNWMPLGPSTVPTSRGGAGRLNCVRFHPTDPDKMYVGAPAGGLWITSDGGNTWSTNTDFLPSIGVSDVVVDHVNPNIIYIGTGDNDAGDTYGIGVLKSVDGGATWNITGLNFSVILGRTVNRLVMNPNDPNMLYAGTSNGLYKTTDGGMTWMRTLSASNIRDIEFKPGNPSVVYAASGNTFFRSTNGGATFTSMTTSGGLPGSVTVSRLTIAVTPAAPDYVYILFAAASTNKFHSIYRSVDSGTNFDLMADAPNLLGYDADGSDDGGQGWYTLSLAVSPTNSDELVVGGVNIWRSDDGGGYWYIVAHWYGAGGMPYVHADIHDLAYNPLTSDLYSANDGGLYRSTDGGGTWTDKSNGLQIAQMYRLGNSVTNPDLVIQGWQDNGSNLYNAGSWDRVLGGDGMEAFIDWSNPNYMYAESQYGGLSRSTNGGGTFNGITTGINEDGAWITPWQQDPAVSATIYAGFKNVWKSTNRGTSWTKISTFNSQLTSLAVAPSNNQYIYASNGSNIFRTTDGGASWSTVSAGAGSLTYLSVCPTDPLKIWTSHSGYTPGVKVFYSSDGGSSWTNLSTGLPNIPVNCVVSQSGTSNGIYVGTDVGVYYRDDVLGSWMPYSNGLPNVIVDELEIHYGSSKLRAATYGRGLWETSIYDPTSPKPFANFKADSTGGCPGLTVQFSDSTKNNPTSWFWTFPGGSPSTSTLQNPVVTYSTPGLYHNVSLVVSNSFGTDSITKLGYIGISPDFDPIVSLNKNDTICQGEVVMISASAGSTYLWSPGGQVTPQFNISVTDTFAVTVTDAFGCANTSAPQPVHVIPNPAAPTISQSGDTLTSSAVSGNQWYLNGTAIGGATAQTFIISSPGTYHVVVTDPATGCNAMSDLVLDINESAQLSEFRLSPNPSSGTFTFSCAASAEARTLKLYDALGKLVEDIQLPAGMPVSRYFDVAVKGPGIYLITLSSPTHTSTQKLIVQ